MVGPLDVKKKEMSQLDVTLTRVPWPLTLTFDLEFSRSNCISGMGDPIVMERKGWESIGCPDVIHKGNESTGCCTDRGTFDLYIWPWIFKVKFYLGNGRPDCYRTKGTGVDRMTWCKTQPLCDLRGRGYCQGPGWLKMSAFPLSFLGTWWNLVGK